MARICLCTFSKLCFNLEALVGERILSGGIVLTPWVRILPSSGPLLHQSRTGSLYGSGLGVIGRLWRGMRSQKSLYRPSIMNIVSLIPFENSLCHFLCCMLLIHLLCSYSQLIKVRAVRLGRCQGHIRALPKEKVFQDRYCKKELFVTHLLMLTKAKSIARFQT